MIADMPQFLDEICRKLDLCLPPAARSRLTLVRFRDPDDLEVAILEGDGRDPIRVSRQLRHDLSELISARWAPGA